MSHSTIGPKPPDATLDVDEIAALTHAILDLGHAVAISIHVRPTTPIPVALAENRIPTPAAEKPATQPEPSYEPTPEAMQQDAFDPAQIRAALRHIGMDALAADGIIRHHAASTITKAIAAAEIKNTDNPAGYVVSALKNGWML